MGRTVSYSVVKRNNPLDQDAVPKFYAQAQANGHVEIREMADRIQKTCTVTRADVMAVLVALEDVIMEALEGDRKSTRLNSSHRSLSRMPSSA